MGRLKVCMKQQQSFGLKYFCFVHTFRQLIRHAYDCLPRKIHYWLV